MNIKSAADTLLINKINALLPQTQCTRCSYPSCRDYALAIAEHNVPINQCPPGGEAGIAKIASLLNIPILPLNATHGIIKNKTLALIDEEACIGCTLCIKACPVDAILGSNKMLHTVIADECTGCDLCVPICPVDCIAIVEDHNPNWDDERINKAKLRFENHNARINRDKLEREKRLEQRTTLSKASLGANVNEIIAKTVGA